MIEFPITLISGGSVYRLHVDATGEWEGLAIRCFWHVPDGKAPASSLVVDGYVAVPASVTAQPGSGCITRAKKYTQPVRLLIYRGFTIR